MMHENVVAICVTACFIVLIGGCTKVLVSKTDSFVEIAKVESACKPTK